MLDPFILIPGLLIGLFTRPLWRAALWALCLAAAYICLSVVVRRGRVPGLESIAGWTLAALIVVMIGAGLAALWRRTR